METDTKTALLNAAEEMVRTRGYDAFSFADLAARVDIRKASVHYHYPSKADLSEALIAGYHKRVSEHCAEISRTAPSAAAKLKALMSFYRDAAGDGECLCLCVSLTTSPANLPSSVTQRLKGFRTMVTDWIERVFIDALRDGSVSGVASPKDEAAAVLALLEGAQLAARPTGSIVPFDAATELFRRRLR